MRCIWNQDYYYPFLALDSGDSGTNRDSSSTIMSTYGNFNRTVSWPPECKRTSLKWEARQQMRGKARQQQYTGSQQLERRRLQGCVWADSTALPRGMSPGRSSLEVSRDRRNWDMFLLTYLTMASGRRHDTCRARLHSKHGPFTLSDLTSCEGTALEQWGRFQCELPCLPRCISC